MGGGRWAVVGWMARLAGRMAGKQGGGEWQTDTGIDIKVKTTFCQNFFWL